MVENTTLQSVSYKKAMVSLSTVAAFAALAVTHVTFPTNPSANPINSIPSYYNNWREPFVYENREEVVDYINQYSLRGAILRLPAFIQRVFGQAELMLSVYKDVEEGWQSLRIEIKSQIDLDDLIEKEDELFAKLEKDAELLAALEYVTISGG